MKKILFLIMVMSMSLFLAACTIVDDTKEYPETVTITQTVTHATSSTDTEKTTETVEEVIPTNPKNVAIFDFGALDILDHVGIETLGIEKLAIVKSNVPSYLSKYNVDSVTNAGTLFEPNFDNLDLFSPDLVIISSRSAWTYDKLKAELGGVAVLNVAVNNTKYLESVENNLDNLKAIFGGNEAFDTMKTTLQTKTAEVKLLAQMSNFKTLIVMTNGDDISGYGVGSRFSFIHNELAFTAADANFGNGDANTHGDIISFEYIQTLNPDVIFVVDRAAAIGGEASTGVLDNALVNATNAAQNNRIIVLDSIAWYIVSGGYQSTLTMINDTKALFS
ncbi:siderophore ABC transporter substrate-binding protein [Paracholeplasma manati]|uniref:ABC transporter substrate-binding protein n=1 Tax=Paracholeplasma manati TaxID=591373 RepID=A0ABT2Y4Y7_9MOLU|nr:ABC transporter substrate-binding protein [Paracholeplasma manati]MCV2231796.1 ABC transporter substrate-binding protein [Paracholeplasma manati]MDG0889282.1 ABC transporter substrate-binding protein [Paracholeplasma manati]